MPRKGMRSILLYPKRPTPASPDDSLRSNILTPRRLLSDSVMDRALGVAESMINKWNPDDSTFAKVTSLFEESSKREAKDFIKCVNDLQRAMHFLLLENSNSHKLVRAQNLMQIAMKRLQKELYQILSMNRAHLDPESLSARSSIRSSTSDYDTDYTTVEEDDAADAIEEVESVSDVAMADLRLIAECMISSGYGKECVKIYIIIRKSIIDEAIYRLGVEKLSSSKIHKMDWEVLDLKIKSWLNAVKISVTTLFHGERILCDHVFAAAASESIGESSFTEITKEAAALLFGFPEIITKHSKKSSTDKVLFRALDMYTAISDHRPAIQSIFSFDSTSTVRLQAISSLITIGESVRLALGELESAIQNDASKSLVGGAGVHPLTTDAMSSLTLLADYSNILGDILAESPPPPPKSSLPESYFVTSDSSSNSQAPAVSLRFAWLILVLLCKLDGKARLYKDASLSYLFLANNLRHIVNRVLMSNLRYLLGDDWLSKHEAKVNLFAASYERLGWDHVRRTLPEDPTAAMSPEEVKECFKKFNSSLEQANRKHSACVIPDSKLRDDIKLSIAGKLLPVYREFYRLHNLRRDRNISHVVRFTPEDVGNYLSDLFFGSTGSGSSSSSHASSSHHGQLNNFH